MEMDPKSTAKVQRWELKVASERGLTFGTHPCCPPKFQPPCKGVVCQMLLGMVTSRTGMRKCACKMWRLAAPCARRLRPQLQKERRMKRPVNHSLLLSLSIMIVLI
eukprot:scaffold59225_cov61-Cyclotella_meneghiniana.AAC.3